MAPTRIQCILIDDGLGSAWTLHHYKWHDQFTTSPTKRIVRVEIVAEGILRDIADEQLQAGHVDPKTILSTFTARLTSELTACVMDTEVAGFKSIACYRTGLDIVVQLDTPGLERSLVPIILRYETTKTLRIADKIMNDFIVNTTLRIAGEGGKPVQFHTGLGDNDITLSLSTPALMQPIIKAYPSTKIVLLHSSYPYTQQAGYLTAVYPNVYLDFGEIFPFLSVDGQRDVIKQVLELCPTNKIMWSTDGHYWPESYYLGALQAREVLYEVLENSIRRQDLTLAQAIEIVKRAFFENANKVYNLCLQPHIV
ncbi:Protein fluG [Grifola frondosa]|uniref:Protein fluG n=1 Tax=Grifola frondosa TaxID=5627 RepID=A0A1C7MC63_GRIFR|nr:Protein fluG [Grifola frondosa]